MHAKAEIHKYHCTQAQLYAVCGIGWRTFMRHVSFFTPFKTRYTLAYAEQMLAEIVSAKELPGDQARNEVHESARIELIRQGKTALNKWQYLKRYIKQAYEKDLRKPHLEGAGSLYYRKASNQNWKMLNAMLVSGDRFIANHFDELTANNNMPPSFQTFFSEVKEEFRKQYALFLDAEEEAWLKTGGKLSANNAIHKNLMEMLLDGQVIFRNNKLMKKLFTFEHLMKLISKPHKDSSGLVR